MIHCRDDQGAGTAPVKRVFLVGYFLGLVQVQQVLALLPVCLYNLGLGSSLVLGLGLTAVLGLW